MTIEQLELACECHVQPHIDLTEENDEFEWIIDNLERWHDRDFRHPKHRMELCLINLIA